jgi:hypothetical protein
MVRLGAVGAAAGRTARVARVMRAQVRSAFMSAYAEGQGWPEHNWPSRTVVPAQGAASPGLGWKGRPRLTKQSQELAAREGGPQAGYHLGQHRTHMPQWLLVMVKTPH